MAFHGNRGGTRARGQASGRGRGAGRGGSHRGRGGIRRGRGKPIFDSARVAEQKQKYADMIEIRGTMLHELTVLGTQKTKRMNRSLMTVITGTKSPKKIHQVMKMTPMQLQQSDHITHFYKV
jgi:antirestriction protein ArdC